MARRMYTVLPVPDCCTGQQMRLCGNLSDREVLYECGCCHKKVKVAVVFVEDFKPALAPETAAETDATP